MKQESNGEEKEETAKENGGGEENQDGEKSGDADAEEKMEEAEGKDEKEDEKKEEEDDTPKPRPLHKTSSIFLRNLAPTITMQEVSQCVFILALVIDPSTLGSELL